MEVFVPLFFVVKHTWWFVTPLILFFISQTTWRYYITRKWKLHIPRTVLEVKIPQEVFKTPKAMEYVIAGFDGVWEQLNRRDRWIRGQILDWFSLEIVGTAGEIHFYIEAPTKHVHLVESLIYSQYPDAEVLEVEDYTQFVPPDIPNKDWELWGCDLRFQKENPYPLRRYLEFEEMVEERRLDPIASIAEACNKLRRNEHIWIQFIISPTDDRGALREEGEKLVQKLMKRPEKQQESGLMGPLTLMGQELAGMFGLAAEKKDEKPELPTWPELTLSPGERDVLKAIEEKINKTAFETMIRFVYFARKDVYDKSNISAIFGYFEQFNTFNANRIRLNSRTYTKRSHFMFRNLRYRFRQMRLFQWYKMRDTLPGTISPEFLLNAEELATMFHFPGQTVKAPTMPRVETRKAAPPAGLPIE